jgi:hypothetical protein
MKDAVPVGSQPPTLIIWLLTTWQVEPARGAVEALARIQRNAGRVRMYTFCESVLSVALK